MALPGRREPSVFDRIGAEWTVTPPAQATGRKATPAEAQRRYRRGHRCTHGAGHPDPVWDERRNGLPVRLYIYRGTGRDAYDGTCLFEELAS